MPHPSPIVCPTETATDRIERERQRRRERPSCDNHRLISIALVLVLLAAAACDGSGSAETTVVETTVAETTAPSGDEVTGVVFDEALTLDEVRAVADDAEATLVAVWRVDAICVLQPFGPPRVESEDEIGPSWFAYIDADVLKALQEQGPPATDGGWSEAMRERFVEEWTAAQEPGVQFIGAALVLPDTATELAGVTQTAVLDSYRTDAGVLYLRSHEEAFSTLFPEPAAADC